MLTRILAVYRSGEGLRLLTLLTTMCGVMLVARMSWWFLFMLTWNLFLAWIPLLLVLFLREGLQQRWFSEKLLWPGLALWLLFLPNSPYIITDLFHVRDVSEHTLFYDTMLLFMCALTGLFAGLYSLLLVHRLLNERMHQHRAWGAVLVCLALTSFGIYLGRYVRLNSWDLFTNPVELTQLIYRSLLHPVALKLTLSYTFALVVLYTGFTRYVQSRTHESLD